MTPKLGKSRSEATSSSLTAASAIDSDSEVENESEFEFDISSGGKATTDPKHASETWTPDDDFFFAFVTFRVEDKLFRVPRHVLEGQSEFFRNLFIPKSQTSSKNITKDVNEPVFLEGVEKDAFGDLLRLLYPSPILSYPVNKLYLSLERWVKLLHLARLWGLAATRDLMIRELEEIKMEEVSKLELALKYEITQWYADAYLALAKRPQPLSIEEGKRLGLELSLKIGQVRERRLTRMVEPEQKGTKAATTGNTTGPFGGTPATFCLFPGNGSTSSTASKSSSKGTPTTLNFALPSQNGSSSTGATSSISPATFGAPFTVFGTPKTSALQPDSNAEKSSSNAFSFGKTEPSLFTQTTKVKIPAPKKLSEDDILKQDIKETFEL